ncbi:hypothetical protein P170DRAFT_433659 [Aspergillus steynii IBT 23096]|uniref:25S rRNA adenine-N(1) methyltransferase n=1 Tax=Aspergillus steynii IBT 23096 TaxID=1392250 RepID=A0A2I2GFY7_9EURO|nr:uncharacterized protein P170DRAFT_433659 [Aspergillus steynii IBT 23096]PLB51789.1 hypothetical protein P170DRAFT_433659 [Aspergillus steynii IBT 23096]
MVAKKRRAKKPLLLSRTRPSAIRGEHAALSSKATRNLIRSHHRLLKQRAQAQHAGDEILVNEINRQIQENGGLESYQLASKLGQSRERGGDSSKVLVDWMGPHLPHAKDGQTRLRVLEVGALSTKNACSTNPAMAVTRIDLNSQEPGILKQDFMERPLPRDDADRFHIISLSLVLNFVPDAIGRGEMLKRCVAFLTSSSPSASTPPVTPRLFLVLPAACVNNSRYLTHGRLGDIMTGMGFFLSESKETSKLIYQLWEYSQKPQSRSWKKEMLNPGKTRNNFAIVVK